MSISYADVENVGLISERVLKCIPRTCPTCGSEVEFTDSLKQISCTNRFCPDKVAARLEAMAKDMKVDEWGFASCRSVCVAFGMKSPYQVFQLGGRHVDGVASFERKVNAFINSPKRRAELWEIVKYGNIPGIDTTAYKIFGGYTSLEDAYADIERYQVPFIAEKLGLKSSETGVMAVSIYNTLIEYKSELEFAVSLFDIIQKEGAVVCVAITGGVIGYTNKQEYIEALNRKFKGKLNIMFMNSVTANVHFLVADHDTGSSKYKKALRLQEKGGAIIITDSATLPMMLEQLIDGLGAMGNGAATG